MKTTVHLVRHGEVHNPTGVFYGRIPGFKLSENGRNQVKKLGKHLSNRSIKKIYASPLDRTKETAAIIQEFFPTIPVSYDERLIEVGSPVQGKPMAELIPSQWNFYIEEFIAQGGESLEDIWKRMSSFFSEVVPLHDNEEIIVVSHGDPIMITAASYQGLPLRFESIRNSVYIETAQGMQLLFDGHTVIMDHIQPV